jgi:AraC family transcriptional regulator, chitin signaling transcriptional activator
MLQVNLRINLIIYLLLSFIAGSVYAQKLPEKGVPALKNYLPSEYGNIGKVWSIKSGNNGIVYMASDRGLVEFDGKNWKTYRGSAGNTRSLLVISDSLIYTGSDLDFGVWKKKDKGYQYTSLYSFKEELSYLNEEFWGVYKIKDKILFASHNNLYILNNNQIVKIATPYKFNSTFESSGNIYFSDESHGLFTLNGLTINPVSESKSNQKFEVAGLLNYSGKSILVTKNEGLFQMENGVFSTINSPLSNLIKEAKVFCVEIINEEFFAIGTVLKGLFIVNKEGRIIQHINKNKGLLNNTVLSLHSSKSGKLWLSMDYSLASLNLSSDISYVHDYRGEFGTCHSAIIKGNYFYLGTNQGLYKCSWDELNNQQDYSNLKLIPGTEGQVWSLKNINDRLYIGHDKGFFYLENDKIRKVNGDPGVWNILPFRNSLLTGQYNGISIYKLDPTGIVFQKKMDLIAGSCNQLVAENDSILWINIPNFGIVRASLDENLNPIYRKLFDSKFFGGEECFISNAGNEIVVFTESHKWKFNSKSKSFEKVLKENSIPFVEGLINPFVPPITLNDQYKVFPIYNGFAFQNTVLDSRSKLISGKLELRALIAFDNRGSIRIEDGHSIPSNFNNIRFDCFIPNQDNILYSYRIGKKSEWSNWRLSKTVELTGLRSGKNSIYVRAKIGDKIIDEKNIIIKIDAPWYLSWYAYVFYLCTLMAMVWYYHYLQNLRLIKQKSDLLVSQQVVLKEQETKYEKELLSLEQQQIQKELLMVKEQLKSKTVELASKAKDNNEKNRLILELKDKFENAQKESPIIKGKWNEIHKILEDYLEKSDNIFENQIDELHQEFFEKLREIAPGLSANDMRLCVYLKIGLSSKEIATILHILPSSVFISRSRLRKKLMLADDNDLYNYLNNL